MIYGKCLNFFIFHRFKQYGIFPVVQEGRRDTGIVNVGAGFNIKCIVPQNNMGFIGNADKSKRIIRFSDWTKKEGNDMVTVSYIKGERNQNGTKK